MGATRRSNCSATSMRREHPRSGPGVTRGSSALQRPTWQQAPGPQEQRGGHDRDGRGRCVHGPEGQPRGEPAQESHEGEDHAPEPGIVLEGTVDIDTQLTAWPHESGNRTEAGQGILE